MWFTCYDPCHLWTPRGRTCCCCRTLPDRQIHMRECLARTFMGLKAHRWMLKPPAKGKKRLKTCTGTKKDVAFGGTLTDLDLGDLVLPTWTLALEGPGRHHGYPRCHPELVFSSWTTFMRHWHMWVGFQAFGGPMFHLPCPMFHTWGSTSP